MKPDKKKLLKIYAENSTPQELFMDVYDLAKKNENDIKTGLQSIEEKLLDEEKVVERIKSELPPVKDGKTPTEKELREIIVPLIPSPLKGKDGNIITSQEVRNKLKELKGKERLSVYDLKDTEWLKGDKREVQWSSAGFKVYTDSTLTGDGSFANPLHAIGSGGGLTQITLTGLVNGSNNTYTSTVLPTWLVVDGVWYLPKDQTSNQNVQWSYTGSSGAYTITTNIIPNSQIWGF